MVAFTCFNTIYFDLILSTMINTIYDETNDSVLLVVSQLLSKYFLVVFVLSIYVILFLTKHMTVASINPFQPSVAFYVETSHFFFFF